MTDLGDKFVLCVSTPSVDCVLKNKGGGDVFTAALFGGVKCREK